MFKLLNEEIEKEFNKAANYNAIISKIERENSMKKFNMKYVLVPTFVIMLVVVAFSTFLIMQSGSNLLTNANKPLGSISSVNRNDKKDDVIYINEYVNRVIGSKATIPVEADLFKKYDFLEKVYIPEGLELIRQNKIYARDINNADTLVFKENEIIYVEGEYESMMYIFFGPDKILGDKDIIYPEKTPKVSIVSGIDVEIYARKENDDNSKYFGEADFKQNNMNFKIEFSGLNINDLVKTIKSIIDNCN